MGSNEDYKVLISVIMKGKMNSFGKLAADKANEVTGLEVDASGAVVTLEGNPTVVLAELLAAFQQIAGKAAIFSAKLHARTFLKEHPDLDVPKELI